MEEHNARGGGIPPFNVVEAHAVALEELANRPVPSFRQKRERYVADHHDHQQRATTINVLSTVFISMFLIAKRLYVSCTQTEGVSRGMIFCNPTLLNLTDVC